MAATGRLNGRLLRLDQVPLEPSGQRQIRGQGRQEGQRGGTPMALAKVKMLRSLQRLALSRRQGNIVSRERVGQARLSTSLGVLGKGRGMSPVLGGGGRRVAWLAGVGVVGRVVAVVLFGLCMQFLLGVSNVGAHVAMPGSAGEDTGIMPPIWKLVLLGVLLVTSACLAGAETAITTLWPWKVKKIAEEEDEKSPFRLLEQDITKFLTAILIGTTTCTIYAAGLAADMAGTYGGEKMVTWATIWLTLVTLVAGEIIPKALAVSQVPPPPST